MSLLVFLFVAQQLAISVSIGAATFALIFYYKAMRDGRIDAEERSFMRTVYLVLRVGLGLIVLSELLLVIDFAVGGYLTAVFSNAFWFRWTLLGIIVANTILMDMKKIPEWIGPAISGASWYTYAVVTILSRAGVDTSYLVWLLWYLLTICIFAALLMVVERVYIKRPLITVEEVK